MSKEVQKKHCNGDCKNVSTMSSTNAYGNVETKKLVGEDCKNNMQNCNSKVQDCSNNMNNCKDDKKDCKKSGYNG